jgi:hypothetical protein
MTIEEGGWETVDAQRYFVEKFKKKNSTLTFFLLNVKNKYLMKVNKNVFKNLLASSVLSNIKL